MKYIKILLRILLWPLYWLSGLIPRDPNIWLFGSWGGDRFADNSKYFFLIINNIEKKNIKPIWISRNKKIVRELQDKGLEAYYLFSISGVYYCLRGKVWIFDNKSDGITFWLSKNTVKTNLWHGIPLKRIEGDDIYSKWLQSQGFRKYFYKMTMPWTFEKIDYILSPATITDNIFKSAFNLKNENIIRSEYPRVKALTTWIDGAEIGAEKELLMKLSVIKKEKIKLVMYMPTFRDRSDEKFFEIINIGKLHDLLTQRNAIFVIKCHMHSKLRNIDSKYTNIINIQAETDAYPFLAISDILITDYSSVYFDYLVCNKPIFFFCYDFEEYISKNRQMYFSYEEVTPGHKITGQDFLSKLDVALLDTDDFDEERNALIEKISFYNESDIYSELVNKIKGRYEKN